MRVFAFGTYDVRMHPRVGVLIEGLRAHGNDVVEINLPLELPTSARVAMVRRPWRVVGLLVRLLVRWPRLAVRARRAMRSGRPDAVLVGHLGHLDIRLAKLVFGRVPLVLDYLISGVGTARDRRVGRGPVMGLLRYIDHGALRRADVVVVDTAEHAELLPGEAAARAVVVPVGAGADWFAAARAAAAGPPRPGDRLRVVFFGLFTPLQGTPVLGEALRQLADAPDVEVLMIGTGQDHAECHRLAAGNPRVRWRDWVPAAELPALVASHDVCLGIFGSGEKAHRVVPTKIYQGAAAGCALVTADTAPARALLDGAAALVAPADPWALAATLRQLAADRDELARLKEAAAKLAHDQFTPAAAVAPLQQALTTK